VTNYIESRINYFIGKINKFKSDFLNKSYNSIKFLKGIKFQKEMSRIKSRKEISILSKKSINLNDIIKEDNNLSNIKKCKSKDKNKTCINFIGNSKFFNNNIINDNEINNVKNMNSKISDTSMKYISFEKNKSKSHSQKIKHYILGKSSYKISKNSLKNLNLNKSNHLPFFIGDFELINKGMKNKDIKDDISKRYNSLNNKSDSYLNTLKNLNLKSIKRNKANKIFLYNLPKIK
jgi:hypothetical protein